MKLKHALLLMFLFLAFQAPLTTTAQDVDADCPPLVVFDWVVERQKWQNALDDIRAADALDLLERLATVHQAIEAVEDLERPSCLDELMLITYAEYNALGYLLICENQTDLDCVEDTQARLADAQSDFNEVIQPYYELFNFNPDEYAAERPEGWQLAENVPTIQQAAFRDDGRIYLGDTVIFDEDVEALGCNPGGEISYAPSGEYFLVVLHCIEGDNELFLFGADGSDSQRITGSGNRLSHTDYAWEEDSRSFVFRRVHSFGASAPPDALPQGMVRYDIETGQTSMVSPFRVVNVPANDALNIRSGPGVDSPVVGQIPFNGTGIRVRGDGVVVGDSRWVPISYEDAEGWANSWYLAEQEATQG